MKLWQQFEEVFVDVNLLKLKILKNLSFKTKCQIFVFVLLNLESIIRTCFYHLPIDDDGLHDKKSEKWQT